MQFRRALCGLALVLGCKGGSNLLRDPHGGQFELTFHNEVGGAVCALHIFPEGEAQEGSSWLAAGTHVESGDSVSFWLDPGVYQVRVVGCTYEKLMASGYAPRVAMNAHGVAVLFREDDAASRDAALRLAHEHENSTRIPAKLTANKSPTPRPPPPQPAGGSAVPVRTE